tara:strand:+ start:49 stop:789 length:741 start_codon:yes stop_codon:yes gene_type:complete
MMKKVLYVFAICALIASATDANTCDSQVESCTEYQQPTKKASFFSRLVYKFWTGASSGAKSIADIGHGTKQKAETIAAGTAVGVGAVAGAVSQTVSTISEAADNTVNSISNAAGSAANAVDQWITSTSISSAKKTLAQDCKRSLVHTLLELPKSVVDIHLNWGKQGQNNWGFCRSVVEKTFEKANDEDPTKHMCQFYDHFETTYLEECNIRHIPQDLCQGYATYTVKMFEFEKSQWCAPGLVTMVK